MIPGLRIVMAISIAIVGLVVVTLGQEPSGSDVPAVAPRPAETRYKFLGAGDPLEMLKETIAANDALLAKQQACLRQLAELADKAQADKSAAHRSTSHGAKN